MDLYIVKPNLEISKCDNCPTSKALLSKKSDYLSLLKKCNKLSELNGGNSHIPSWCHSPTIDNTLNSGLTLSHFSLPNLPSDDDNKDNNNKNNNDSEDEDDNDNDNELNLPLQSIKLVPTDYTKSPSPDSVSLSKLEIPLNITSIDGKWLALKYLQLTSDIALLRYKYLKSYTKINNLVKKYFSKPQVSEDEESSGCKLIDQEMSKFKKFENILTLLLDLKKKFKERFNHFETESPI
jgi:hypothetical protein